MTTKNAISSLESHTGYWLRFVSNHVSHAFRHKVESRGVTVAEWVVLRALFDAAETSPSKLAESIGVTRGTVSKLVDRLSAKHLVTCRAEKWDRRYQTVNLTSSGRRLVPALAALADENDEEFFGHLDSAERFALISTLRNIVERRGLRGAPVE
ncbi:MAG: MarR family winged helix-turn-helix transcriptional regulator [Phycisphaerales bacterium]|nr:winged helix-turn-helix transcriptional regulator [Planctomycetota bacterium]